MIHAGHISSSENPDAVLNERVQAYRGLQDGKMESKCGQASGVMRVWHRTILLKRDLSQKAKLLVYKLSYVPTLIHGHEFCVVTEKVRLLIQAAGDPEVDPKLTGGIISAPIRRGNISGSLRRSWKVLLSGTNVWKTLFNLLTPRADPG